MILSQGRRGLYYVIPQRFDFSKHLKREKCHSNNLVQHIRQFDVEKNQEPTNKDTFLHVKPSDAKNKVETIDRLIINIKPNPKIGE